MKLNRYFGDLAVEMARKQTNVAGNFSEVQGMIIQNYDFLVTDTTDGNVYIFDKIN